VVVWSLEEAALARGAMDSGPVVTKSFSGIDVSDHWRVPTFSGGDSCLAP